ncbi:MAG: peptide ABC transporter substrate-binding protein [Candidatus Melainabacteria bacterium]|nr:peptide ABC transporter substrate-binding protein [Candidatus Melainabacteria bacterium]
MAKLLENKAVSAPEDEVRDQLIVAIRNCIFRFPHLFDARLYKGLEKLLVNSPKDFLTGRPFRHLEKLLVVQFFLQKKMEDALSTESFPLFLKLFRSSSRITVAIVIHDSYRFHREQILKTFQILVPGILEIPRSFYLWHHPELPYLFCHLEINKLRGEEFSKSELRLFENALSEQLIAISPLTPALFWPYNEEESYRQIQLLQREVRSKHDLPHVLLQFREQTNTSLEFLIHLVRPKAEEGLENALKRLPESLHSFSHFCHVKQSPFPIECGSFSLKVPSNAFDVRDSINLLYARRYVLKYLEGVIGPFRDYNGGLFEKQQQHFESIRVHLADKVPHFDLFAEKLFYALHPVERRLSLSVTEAEELFSVFSKLMQERAPFVVNKEKENVTIIKAANSAELHNFCRIVPEAKKIVAQAHIALGGFHYLCLVSPIGTPLRTLLKTTPTRDNTKFLRLIFQEGAPTSLNPYHSFGDMRCRILSKLLFEGLMRLNAQGKPELAGASHVQANDLTYTFQLRPSYWSNGEKVTAADYAMSLQYALNDHVSHPELLFMLKNARRYKEKRATAKDLGIRALSTDTLQLELEWHDPHFLHRLAQPYFFPLFGPMREPKWFNGPYLLREKNKEGLILERNPYFWDPKRTHFEQIEVRWQEDVDAIFSLFNEGKTDWIGDPTSTLSSSCIDILEKENKLCKRTASRRFVVCFNTKHPILSSASIRRALALSIDRSALCGEIFPHSIPLQPLHPQKELALRYFEQGLRRLGLTKETFPTLTFTYSSQTRREKLARSLQADWQNTLGISVQLEKYEWNLFRNKLEKGAFEMSGTIQEALDETTLESFKRFEGASSWNFSQWENAPYRQLISSAKKTLDPQLRQNLLSQAKMILDEEVPITPLFHYTHLFAHSPGLENFLIDPEGCVDFSQARCF